jgi:hypothetical protein
MTEDISFDSIFVRRSRSAIKLYSLLTGTQMLLLSQIEVNVASISTSAPTLRPLLKNTSLSFSQTDAYDSVYRDTISSAPTDSRNRARFSGQLELLSLSDRNAMARQKCFEGGRE